MLDERYSDLLTYLLRETSGIEFRSIPGKFERIAYTDMSARLAHRPDAQQSPGE
jgi:hypothetical protein